MSGRRSFACATAACLMVLAVGPVVASPRESLSSKEVVARVRRYVSAYLPRLAELVAEEEYTQQGLGAEPTTRVLISDFAVVRADDGMWVGFRDVWKVDGQELPERRARAEQLFGAGRLDATSARQIIEESARFNIADRVRDFNTPIVALELLSESRAWCCRVSARPMKEANVAGRWLVEVRETDRATLVQTPDGEPAFMRVQLYVEAETGAITWLELRVGKPDPVTITVTFDRNASLDLWLPDEMAESSRGRVDGRARYTRWRRFGATSRIIGG